jgi:hypothetical protein
VPLPQAAEGRLVTRFVEATVIYRAAGIDPRDPSGLRSEERLINLDAVRLITPTVDGAGHTLFQMREGSPSYFTILEPYEYWQAILTADQPRPAS